MACCRTDLEPLQLRRSRARRRAARPRTRCGRCPAAVRPGAPGLPRGGSRRPRARRGSAWPWPWRAAGTAGRSSRPAGARTAGSVRLASRPFRYSVSSLMDGSGTRVWIRRCSWSSSIWRSAAAERSGWSCFNRRSSAISRDSGRAEGDRSRTLRFAHARDFSRAGGRSRRALESVHGSRPDARRAKLSVCVTLVLTTDS